MGSGERWRLGRRPALDGLRGVAILLVLAGHASHGWHFTHTWLVNLGNTGVTVFFTLSGFLISSLLLEERARDGGVRLGRFYARRARRLFPALAVMLVAVGMIQTATGMVPAGRLLYVVGYVGNWSMAAGVNMGLLPHTWSLAIEEQFYILWPVALIFACRWRLGPLVLAGFGVVASTVLRFVLWDGGAGAGRVHFGSDTEAAALLVGCVLAALATRGLRPIHPRWSWAAAAAVVPVIALPGAPGGLLIPVVVPVLTAVVIWSGSAQQTGVLTHRWPRYFGRRSYGIYLWHYPLVLLFDLTLGPSVAWALVAVALGVGVAEVSWRFVEAPVLGRRSGLADSVGRRAPRRRERLGQAAA